MPWQETGKWSAISTAILPLVLEVTKLEWIWSTQLIVVSVMRVASNIKGLKPSEWTGLKYSFAIYCALNKRIDINITWDQWNAKLAQIHQEIHVVTYQVGFKWHLLANLVCQPIYFQCHLFLNHLFNM